MLAEILRSSGVTALPSNRVTIGSDYCGDDGTVWWTAAFLILDWTANPSPKAVFEELLARHSSLPQWKDIRTHRDLVAATDYLETATELKGYIVTFTSRAKMFDISMAKGSYLQLSEHNILRHDWSNRKRFERATRVCHVLSRILQVATYPNADVEWFTDRDEICESKAARLDLVSIVTSLRRHYCGSLSPAIRIASSLDAEHAKISRALAVVPDLVAGAVNEKICSQVDFSMRQNFGETHTVSLEMPIKAERFLCIESWLARDTTGFKKLQIVADCDGDNVRLHRTTSHPF